VDFRALFPCSRKLRAATDKMTKNQKLKPPKYDLYITKPTFLGIYSKQEAIDFFKNGYIQIKKVDGEEMVDWTFFVKKLYNFPVQTELPI